MGFDDGCMVCGSIYHWKADCPDNPNKGKYPPRKGKDGGKGGKAKGKGKGKWGKGKGVGGVDDEWAEEAAGEADDGQQADEGGSVWGEMVISGGGGDGSLHVIT